MLEIEVTATEDYTLCRPVGELDAYTVNDFREALGGVAEATHLLIDLSNVPFMDSAGLGALIGGIRRTRRPEGIGGCSPPVGRSEKRIYQRRIAERGCREALHRSVYTRGRRG